MVLSVRLVGNRQNLARRSSFALRDLRCPDRDRRSADGRHGPPRARVHGESVLDRSRDGDTTYTMLMDSEGLVEVIAESPGRVIRRKIHYNDMMELLIERLGELEVYLRQKEGSD